MLDEEFLLVQVKKRMNELRVQLHQEFAEISVVNWKLNELAKAKRAARFAMQRFKARASHEDYYRIKQIIKEMWIPSSACLNSFFIIAPLAIGQFVAACNVLRSALYALLYVLINWKKQIKISHVISRRCRIFFGFSHLTILFAGLYL